MKIAQRTASDAFALEYIRNIRGKDYGIGGRKLWYMYKRDFKGNNPVGRDSFENIIDRYHLKVRQKTRKPRTTDSRHGLPTYPNLIKDLIPTRCNQIWVSDITYITIWEDAYHTSFCYLSLILDAYSEEIVGYHVGASLATRYTITALRMALERICGKQNIDLIHHSDRGLQYASHDYINLLKEYHIRISMTETGDPKDNAQAERINNTMKNELLKGMRFSSIEEVQEAVKQAVDFYNHERPHMSIDMLVPSEACAYKGDIPKRWNSRREQSIRSRLDIPENSLPLPVDSGSKVLVNFLQE